MVDVDAGRQRSVTPETSRETKTPAKWSNFLARVMGLWNGRYIIVLTVESDKCDYTVNHAGKVER